MMKLFGTDGIRGEVGKYPLTQEAIFALGRTLGVWLKQRHPQQNPLKIVIGKDTRESGDELELALLNGVQSEGLEALCVGICPTPAVAYLTVALGAQIGAAISASHNPCTDNGIKFFDARGYKLFPADEAQLEEIFFSLRADKKEIELKSDDSRKEIEAKHLYCDFVKKIPDKLDLSSLTVVIDCAFGSFSKIAPCVLQELGARVFAINNEPDGKNINANCGTLYPQAMAEKVLQAQADIGIAFDGDGDRVIVADEKGNILDGDHLLAIFAEHLLGQKRLKQRAVISTQMSNIGLELCLREQDIQMIRAGVGDKYVLQEMLKRKVSLGGEQSGHIILLEHTTTGDGLIVALELIEVMLTTGKTLSALAANLQKFPQVLVNVKVREKKPLEQIPGLNDELNRCQTELGRDSRILLRYSGTENLARIMVEGQQDSLVKDAADSLARVVQDAAGVKE